jgi:hypothetical protein
MGEMNRMPGWLVLNQLARRRTLTLVVGAAVLVLVAAGAALAVGISGDPSPHVVSVPADGRSGATLDVVSGTRLLSVRVANLGGTSGTLARAATPDGTPVRPVLRTAGTGAGGTETVFLTLASAADSHTAGNRGKYAVTITLNAAVAWQLNFGGGTERTVADFRGGRLSGLAFTAGSDVIDMTLPRPAGTVPIRLAGGASQFLLRVPRGVPVRVWAYGGAGQVSLHGASRTGVGGGSVFTTPGWPTATARVDVDATAGAARVAVTSWAG